MRQLFLLAVLLLSCAWVAAQNYPSSGQKQSGQQQSGSAMSGSQTKVEGCLSGADGKYTLTDKHGTTYELTGDTSKLAEHVGHTVEITGTSSGSATSTGNKMGAGAAETLDVTSVKHIAKTCKNAGEAMPK